MAVRAADISASDPAMTRSTRIRKPSQKAKEIAEAIQPAKSPPSSSHKPSRAARSATKLSKSKKRKSPITVTAKVKAGGKKGRAVVDEDGDVQIEEVDAQQLIPGPDENDDALYCICLGHDDHTPMIQCEECENWFHFACIQLDPSEASIIQAFYCDVCEASGSGKTQSRITLCRASDNVPSRTLVKMNKLKKQIVLYPDPNHRPSMHNNKGGASLGDINRRSDTLTSCGVNELAAENEESEMLTTESTGIAIATSDREEITQNAELEQETDTTLDPSGSNASTQAVQTNEPDADFSVPAPPPSGDHVIVPLPSEPFQETIAAIHPSAPAKSARRKHRRAEGLTSEEDDSDDDEDFTGEEVIRPSRKKRRAPATSDNRRPSRIPSPQTPQTPSTPISGIDKTRTACIEQFFKLFEPAFATKSEEQEETTEAKKKQSETEATRFAESVESELFESFGELDPKNVKAPRKQYMTKFRSLLFNLKHNPIFLNSLSTTDISPKSIVHMSNQDLQTPEQRAISEQIRQRALHDSVRNVISAPTAKMTHKGEQAIESFDPSESQDAEISGPQRGNSMPLQRSQTGGSESLHQRNPITRPMDAGQMASPTLNSPLGSDITRPLIVNESTPADQHLNLPHDETSLYASAAETSASIGNLNPFDLESVFAAMSSVPPAAASGIDNSPGLESGTKGPVDDQNDDGSRSSEDNMDLEATPEHEPEVDQRTEGKAGHLPDDYDPFVVAHGGDADLDAILYGDQSTTPKHTPPTAPLQLVMEAPAPITLPAPATIPEAVGPKTDESVWKGNVMTADAGGFAACAIQVGGRPLCTSSSTWERLFPTETLTVVGRLPVKDSTSYLVQSHFAASRELVVLDLSPNLDGPPDLPSPDRVMQHQQNLIDFFTKKGRHAVVAVHDRAKHVLRDIYLVPLLKQEALPEFVQLLDEVTIEESTPRPRDMLLAVLVLQKGAIPTGSRPSPTSSGGILPPISAPAEVPPTLGGLQPQLQAQAQPQPLAPLVPTFNPPPTQLPQQSTTPVTLPQTNPALFPPNFVASIPMLQSLSSALSAAPQLPFNLFPQAQPPPPPAPAPINTTTPSTGIGPPPGFVPYVAPPSATPSAPTPINSLAPPAGMVDLSHVDVNALQALLSNPQVFRPATDPAFRLAPPPSLPQPYNITMAGSGHFNSYSAPAHQMPSTERPAYLLTRPAGLPPTPQMTMPWPIQHERDHRNLNAGPRNSEPDMRPRAGGLRMQDTSWTPPHIQRGQNDRGGWDPIGERAQFRPAAANNTAADASYRRRSVGRGGGLSPGTGKRSGGPHEFVAPPQDGGWAGRGRGRAGGNNGNRSVSDHQLQRDEDQYSAPIWMGR